MIALRGSDMGSSIADIAEDDAKNAKPTPSLSVLIIVKMMILIFATWILNGLVSIISYNKSLVITIMRRLVSKNWKTPSDILHNHNCSNGSSSKIITIIICTRDAPFEDWGHSQADVSHYLVPPRPPHIILSKTMMITMMVGITIVTMTMMTMTTSVLVRKLQ